MFTPSRLLIAATAMALLAGCATNNNPYQTQDQTQTQTQTQTGQQGGIGRTAKYGGLGALAGAAAGALIDHDNRGKGALIGAAVGGAAGAGYGYYADKQEAQLRQQMASSGVSVDRQGDTIHLQAPEAITFSSGRADLKPAFYPVLDKLADSLRQYPDTVVQVEGHTDSSGSASQNQMLSENRANNVRSYLMQRGIPGSRLVAVGYGASRPLASNDTASGRAQNRRVEILIVPRQ